MLSFIVLEVRSFGWDRYYQSRCTCFGRSCRADHRICRNPSYYATFRRLDAFWTGISVNTASLPSHEPSLAALLTQHALTTSANLHHGNKVYPRSWLCPVPRECSHLFAESWLCTLQPRGLCVVG